jgi:hypothetical protein
VPFSGIFSDGAPSAREQQLIAQVQLMQQRIEQLERQVEEMAARPSDCASAVAALCMCTPRQQQSTLPLSARLSTGQQLHKDALHCVFTFLSLRGLPLVMRSCRAWYAAVRSLPLQDFSFHVSTRQLYRLPLSASSPLARHIVKCDVSREYTAEDLAQFLACLPRLRSLSHQACYSTELQPQLYSGQLRQLKVDLAEISDDDTDELIAQMEYLRSATGLRSLTLALRIGYNVDDIASFSLEPLECLLQLESLTLDNGASLPPAKLVPLRRLPSLRTLSLGGWSSPQMLALVEDRTDCPPLQLHAFEGIYELNLETAQLLVRMPTLQRVEPDRITPDALQLLAHGLPDLRTLQINTPPRGWSPAGHRTTQVYDWPTFRAGLAACHQLTDLALVEAPLEEIGALLLALPPSVFKLDINYCDGFLQSDAFFHCVTGGGLRQLHQLQVFLDRSRDDEGNSACMAAWLERQRACAPWIKVVLNRM